MLRAGAIYIVLVISFLLGFLAISVIMLGFYYRKEVIDYNLERKLSANVNSAIKILLSDEKLYQENIPFDLYGEENDSVRITNQQWGVFELGNVSANSGGKVKKKAFFYGFKPAHEATSSLYLPDDNRPVSVCGKTKIKGDVYLPQPGIQRAYIAGKSFEGDELVEGKILNSKTSLYKVDESIVAELKKLLNNQFLFTHKRIVFTGEDMGSVIKQSFTSDTCLVLFSDGTINLTQSVSGKVMIVSTESIIVNSSAKLKDVVVLAPYVNIATGFNGNIQVYATDSIHIKEGARLNYPSALGLLPEIGKSYTSKIDVADKAKIAGLVFSISTQDFSYPPLISIGKDSEIYGQVYSSGYLDLKGKVFGHTAAQKLRLNTGASIYINHLLDAVLDYSGLPSQYVGSALFPFQNGRRVMKWHY